MLKFPLNYNYDKWEDNNINVYLCSNQQTTTWTLMADTADVKCTSDQCQQLRAFNQTLFSCSGHSLMWCNKVLNHTLKAAWAGKISSNHWVRKQPHQRPSLWGVSAMLAAKQMYYAHAHAHVYDWCWVKYNDSNEQKRKKDLPGQAKRKPRVGIWSKFMQFMIWIPMRFQTTSGPAIPTSLSSINTPNVWCQYLYGWSLIDYDGWLQLFNIHLRCWCTKVWPISFGMKNCSRPRRCCFMKCSLMYPKGVKSQTVQKYCWRSYTYIRFIFSIMSLKFLMPFRSANLNNLGIFSETKRVKMLHIRQIQWK